LTHSPPRAHYPGLGREERAAALAAALPPTDNLSAFCCGTIFSETDTLACIFYFQTMHLLNSHLRVTVHTLLPFTFFLCVLQSLKLKKFETLKTLIKKLFLNHIQLNIVFIL
jgi:hypothetical protein